MPPPAPISTTAHQAASVLHSGTGSSHMLAGHGAVLGASMQQVTLHKTAHYFITSGSPRASLPPSALLRCWPAKLCSSTVNTDSRPISMVFLVQCWSALDTPRLPHELTASARGSVPRILCSFRFKGGTTTVFLFLILQGIHFRQAQGPSRPPCNRDLEAIQ